MKLIIKKKKSKRGDKLEKIFVEGKKVKRKEGEVGRQIGRAHV